MSLELVLAESLVSVRRGVEINSLVRRLRRNSLDICAAAVEALLLLTGCWAGGRDEHALHDLVAELEVAGSIASSHARKALLTTVDVLLEELYEMRQNCHYMLFGLHSIAEHTMFGCTSARALMRLRGIVTIPALRLIG